LEYFALDDLESALARLEEITPDESIAGAEAPVAPGPPENACARVGAEFARAWSTKGPAGIADLVGDGAWEDRRRGLRHVVEGHAAMMSVFGAVYDVGATVIEVDLLETRGARRAPGRLTMR